MPHFYFLPVLILLHSWSDEHWVSDVLSHFESIANFLEWEDTLDLVQDVMGWTAK